MKVITASVRETLRLGEFLSKHLKPGDIICLKGNLGSGKTTLTKGIASGLGVSRIKVTSPSFVIMRQHLEGRVPLFHFDLYRLKEVSDIAALGYEGYFYAEGISVIEWAQNLDCLMPKEHLMIELSYGSKDKRIIKITAVGIRYKELLREMRAGSLIRKRELK
ncbi:MAG: tRNA (adenosine(37)-N6)-threonylcarbamoyltransferase complex ATPase subunit type 1 TsaE [Candidatus Omnitrophota bacterium]|jgi:tRNA threonylcarbamoyladenosine biosynthesis protein TsaE